MLKNNAVLSLALLLVLATGCPPELGDDDDSVGDDDDSVGDDDDSVGDDDDSVGPGESCTVDDVLGAGCLALDDAQWFSFDGWCEVPGGQPQGLVFRDVESWDDFFESCNPVQADPVSGLDWSASLVVGTVAWAGGCDGTSGNLWVASCAGDEWSLGYYSTGCGECDAIWTTLHFAIVPASGVTEGLEQITPVSCVPEGEECEDRVDG